MEDLKASLLRAEDKHKMYGRRPMGGGYGRRQQVQRIDPEASQAMLRQLAVRPNTSPPFPLSLKKAICTAPGVRVLSLTSSFRGDPSRFQRVRIPHMTSTALQEFLAWIRAFPGRLTARRAPHAQEKRYRVEGLGNHALWLIKLINHPPP